jgi:hypothetical protein
MVLEKLKDKWLTWRTGKDKAQRDWEKWREENIVLAAHDVQNYFMNFKHIIEVNPAKIWNHAEPFGWVTCEEFKQYEFPAKPLGSNAVANWFRGDWDQWSNRFRIDDCFGKDHVFVATNSGEDAVMIALKFC